MTELEREAIEAAWQEEGSLTRLGLRPVADADIQQQLIPAGGDWQCVAGDGAITRSITWNAVEVALLNPGGDLPDHVEGEIGMGMRACPVMDKALRVIFILAREAEKNRELIIKIARAAIAYAEQPAPALHEPENEEGDDEPAWEGDDE